MTRKIFQTTLFVSLIALMAIPVSSSFAQDPCATISQDIADLQQAQADAMQAVQDARVANANGDVAAGYKAQTDAAKAARDAHAAYMKIIQCPELDAEQLENARLTADAASRDSIEAGALAVQTQNGEQVWVWVILVAIIVIVVGNTVVVIRIWVRLPR